MVYALLKKYRNKQCYGHEEEQILVTLLVTRACHRYVKNLGITHKFPWFPWISQQGLQLFNRRVGGNCSLMYVKHF